jgi:uncharacterized membrane protein YsdA (DUF1294 family)
MGPRQPCAVGAGAPMQIPHHNTFAAWRKAHPPSRPFTLFGLLGGWPGAWFAHRLLRHKSRKASFRAAYWGTVTVHCVALVAWLLARAPV